MVSLNSDGCVWRRGVLGIITQQHSVQLLALYALTVPRVTVLACSQFAINPHLPDGESNYVDTTQYYTEHSTQHSCTALV